MNFHELCAARARTAGLKVRDLAAPDLPNAYYRVDLPSLLVDAASNREQARELSRVLHRLIRDENVPPGSIAVLVSSRRAVPELVQDGRIGAFEVTFAPDDPRDRVLVESVTRFKGLERDMVILVRLDPVEYCECAPMLHVGASRARQHLVVIGGPDVLARFAGAAAAPDITSTAPTARDAGTRKASHGPRRSHLRRAVVQGLVRYSFEPLGPLWLRRGLRLAATPVGGVVRRRPHRSPGRTRRPPPCVRTGPVRLSGSQKPERDPDRAMLHAAIGLALRTDSADSLRLAGDQFSPARDSNWARASGVECGFARATPDNGMVLWGSRALTHRASSSALLERGPHRRSSQLVHACHHALERVRRHRSAFCEDA